MKEKETIRKCNKEQKRKRKGRMIKARHRVKVGWQEKERMKGRKGEEKI